LRIANASTALLEYEMKVISENKLLSRAHVFLFSEKKLLSRAHVFLFSEK